MDSKRDLLLPFAVDKWGNWVGPRDVERGLACDCFCPTCHNAVIARQGQSGKVVWHFAHRSRGGNSGCGEGAIHLLAKDVLEESKGKCIKLPGGKSDDQNFLIDVRKEVWINLAERQVDVLAKVRHRSRTGHVRGQSASLFPYESLAPIHRRDERRGVVNG